MLEYPTVDKLLEEIGRLKEAHDILTMVWNDIGPYGGTSIGEQLQWETVQKMQNYFDFDDSE